MPNISQQSGDKSAAALSLATRISEQLMPQMSQMEMGQNPMQEGEMGMESQPEDGTEGQEMPEEQEMNEMMDEQDKSAETEAKLDVLSQDMLSVKEMLQQLLNKDE